ncbi:MAG: hypothetical protein ACJARO_002142 [Bacteriovoracaceae bacterium]|jgi:hypothetical protein
MLIPVTGSTAGFLAKALKGRSRIRRIVSFFIITSKDSSAGKDLLLS